MDVCILAGGKGTRLAGVWDGPKCLVPVGGVPIIERIAKKAWHETEARKVVISLGWLTGAIDVLRWWEKDGFVKDGLQDGVVRFAIEPAPIGRLRALISCLPALTPPILVLNGDTLPRYKLSELGTDSAVAMYQRRPAGAYVIDEQALNVVVGYRGPVADLDQLLLCFIERRVGVPAGFLDVGTPEGFATAQQLDAAEG